jgi:hypothetical protein
MPPRSAGQRPGAKPSRLKGCLVAAGIGVAAVLLVVGIVMGIAAWKFRSLRSEFTDPELKALPVAEVNSETAKRLNRTVEQFLRAVDGGRSEQFTLTGTQLNQVIAVLPAAREARGRVHLAIEGDRLSLQAGFPLDQVPGFQGRYLNGEFTLDVRVENGQLQIFVREATVRGKPLPKVLVDRFRGENLADRLLRDPDARRLMGNVKSLRLADGKLHLETGR